MTRPISDRDMLTRTLVLIENGQCCDFFACPGPDARPVPMESCACATAAYELRQYLHRHGGWCPEHGQRLGQCHPDHPSWLVHTQPEGLIANHHVCTCAPIDRSGRARARAAGQGVMTGEPGSPGYTRDLHACVDRFGNISVDVQIGEGPGTSPHHIAESAEPGTVARFLRELAGDVERVAREQAKAS